MVEVCDGVDEEHVDVGEPSSFTETWSYTLVTDTQGTVLRGTWDEEDKHPDCLGAVQQPAASSVRRLKYLDYAHMLEQLGDDLERR